MATENQLNYWKSLKGKPSGNNWGNGGANKGKHWKIKDTSKMIGHYAKIVIINMAEENNYG